MWDVLMPEPRLCDRRAESIACGSTQYLIETGPGNSCQYVPEACWSVLELQPDFLENPPRRARTIDSCPTSDRFVD